MMMIVPHQSVIKPPSIKLTRVKPKDIEDNSFGRLRH